MTTADSSIELATLGRPFQLGMLYDCRSDSLIPGVTLWNLEELQKDIDVRPKPYTDFQIIASDSLEDKTSALNVEASLAASFFSGLVTVKGSAKYLNDKKASKRQSRVSLQYLTTTRFEQLTMNHLGYSNVTYPNVFKEGTATHVVTAVLYGAQAFFVFDKQVSSEENEQDIQGSLKVSINKIPFMSIEGEGSLKMTDTERKSTEGFSCKFYGDFALENNPVSFEEAIKTYATLSELLGENGKNAVPMRVWLYPLNKLDSQAAQLVRQISIGLVRRSQQVLEEFNEHEMQCNDMMNDSVAIQFPEIKKKLRKFKDMCSEYKLVFQKSLARALPSIRGGGEEEGVLVDILSGKEQSPFQNTMLTEWLEDKEREMNVMRSYLSIMKNATVVSSSSELDQIVLDYNNEFVVCFTFTSLKQKETYLKGLKSYLASQTSGISETPDAWDSKEEPAKWFRSVEISRQIRERVRLFLDFEKINKSKESTKFIVASIQDDLNAGSSVYLYERGVLETSNFELPSKPETPAVCRTTHDSVELKFTPLRNSFSEIVKYQASLARLTKLQQYVFDSILSIFGKDMEENILILVTFADCDDIPALGAIKAAKLPCHKDKKGQPTHFAFNNSAIYTQNCVLKKLSDDNDTSDSESDEEDNSLRKKKDVWLDSSKHMKRFFRTLEKVKGKSLLLTKKVLEERQRLETALKQLVPQIQMGLSKLNEIKSMRSSLEQHEASLTANKDFETEIEELRAKRKKTNIVSTNCNTCLFSCHSACYLPTPEEISSCAVIDDAGNCVICPGNCHYSAHSSEMALWEYESVKVKTTIGQLKDNFVKASGEFMTTKEILAKLEDEFHKIEDKLMQLIEMSSNCLARLEEIALKPNTLSTVEYIDLLIHNEKEERKPGFEDRIQNLTEMKSQAEIMAKIAKGEKLLPEEKKKYKEKMEKLKKIASQMKQTSSIVKAWHAGH
ncbi:UNVERIFIED_CONTAM: hypothetical protein FKN15_005707 [Acipenser sinensis]